MNFEDLNQRLGNFVHDFMYGGRWIPIVALGILLIVLTFIPVVGELIGVIVLAVIAYLVYRWIKTF